jgi:hypothetical protein
MTDTSPAAEPVLTKTPTPIPAPPGDNQVPEINREEILKQIFGDVGDLIDGRLSVHRHQIALILT